MLYIIATPIGNLADISPRALDAFREADIIACEDTRRTRILLNHYKIETKYPIISYREQNEIHVGEKLGQQLADGKIVALCTDGGYPGVSDPGYRLIKLAIERNLELTVIPGASAVPMALLLSGLPTSSFTFKGFPPRKNGQRLRFFEMEKELPHTLVIFESPFRVAKTLISALEALGERQAAVCIELTKKFENISRGWLSDLIKEFENKKIKGEVSIAIAGNNHKFMPANIKTNNN